MSLAMRSVHVTWYWHVRGPIDEICHWYIKICHSNGTGSIIFFFISIYRYNLMYACMHGYSFQHFIVVKIKLTALSISDHIVFILCESK